LNFALKNSKYLTCTQKKIKKGQSMSTYSQTAKSGGGMAKYRLDSSEKEVTEHKPSTTGSFFLKEKNKVPVKYN